MMMDTYSYKNKTTEVIAIKTCYERYINYVYLYIDKQTNQGFIVDPSWNSDEIEKNIKGITLMFVLITHSHEDHTNLANYFANKYNIPVYMSKKESDFYSFQCANLVTLKKNQVINFGNNKIECLMTPGHTPGSMCYLTKDSLFSGDTLFIEGCGTTDFLGGSVECLFDSIELLKYKISDEIMIFPGHKFKADVGKTMGYIKENNIYFHVKDKEMFLKIKSGHSSKNIFYGC